MLYDWYEHHMVANRCGASRLAELLSGVSLAVDLGHEFSVGAACGGEFLVAGFQLQAHVDDLLFEVDDAPLQLVDVGGRAEAGGLPRLLAEQFGSAEVRAEAEDAPDRVAAQ